MYKRIISLLLQGKWSPDFSGNPNLNVTVAN